MTKSTITEWDIKYESYYMTHEFSSKIHEVMKYGVFNSRKLEKYNVSRKMKRLYIVQFKCAIKYSQLVVIKM